MANDKSRNLQELFLNNVRKSHASVTVFLVNGVKLQGVITWFDNFSILLKRDQHVQLVYKHAISTIMPMAPVQLQELDDEAEEQATTESRGALTIMFDSIAGDVADLVRAAGDRFVLPRYGVLADEDIATKTSPTDLVTVADREAEAWLTPACAALSMRLSSARKPAARILPCASMPWRRLPGLSIRWTAPTIL